MLKETVTDKYVKAAITHGDFNNSVDEVNRAYDTMVEMRAELWKLPDQGRGILTHLTRHENLDVRIAAATDLLPLNERKAILALESAAKKSGLSAFTAKMVLQEWRNGNLVDYLSKP